MRAAKAHTIRRTAPLQLHRVAVQQNAALTTADAGPAERKAYRVYATRIQAAEQ